MTLAQKHTPHHSPVPRYTFISFSKWMAQISENYKCLGQSLPSLPAAFFLARPTNTRKPGAIFRGTQLPCLTPLKPRGSFITAPFNKSPLFAFARFLSRTVRVHGGTGPTQGEQGRSGRHGHWVNENPCFRGNTESPDKTVHRGRRGA